MSELITRNGGQMSSVNFMRLLKSTFCDGVIDGCNITRSGTTLNISAGHLIVGGAYVEIGSSSANISASGELVMCVNTQSDTPAEMVLRAAQTLTRQDLTNGGTIYELQLAKFTYSSGTVSSFAVTVQKAQRVTVPEIYVQSAQPTNPSTGDLWFW